ncbi:MAG TPA: PAS domain-containing protein [Bacteroidales bacterium]|nr:PAS domain-containing protein [Bacteroidales bacterium]
MAEQNIFQDQEERIKVLEKELSTCKAQLNSFINNFPFVSWIKDVEGKYLYANDPFLQILDKQASEVVGALDKDILPDYKIAKDIEEDNLVQETGRRILFTEKEGDRWFEIYKSPIKDQNDNVIGIAGMQRDVSDIRKAVENLNTERDLLQALMDNFPYTIYFKDRDSKFTRINKAQATMLGINDPDDAIGKTDFDYFTRQHAQNAYDDEQQILTTGNPMIGKTEHLRSPKGNDIWVSATKIPIRNNRGDITGLVGISIDVTEKYLAERKLIEARKKAVESDKLKSAFLANMSHEIRTPMNGIIGFSNLLKNPGLNRDQQMEYVGFIEKCGNSLLNLIDDIIDVSKIEAEQLVVREAETNINDILQELFITFDKNRILENKGEIELRLVIPQEPLIESILTDPFRLKQILNNLISNALKFTEQGFIEFGYKLVESEIQFHVKDTGLGIPSDKFDLIFDRFGQVLENERLNRKGTGLGLAISINLVKLLGGKMWLESEVGRGSVFYFTIPRRNNFIIDDRKKQLYPVVNNFEWIGKKLLVVDDEELNWIFIRDLIKPTKAELIWARNGKEAVDIYQGDSNIDLILMDFRMPVMNGFEATKVIRSFDSQIPIIALTAFAQEDEKELILHAGCNAFLSKPVGNDQLIKMVNHFLQN